MWHEYAERSISCSVTILSEHRGLGETIDEPAKPLAIALE